MTRHRHLPDQIKKDFLGRIDKADPDHPGCWIYRTTKPSKGAKGGYAYVKDFDRKVIGAHVFAVELATGKKHKGFEVHHRTEGAVCTSKRCVRYEVLPNGNPNPANHLEVLTETENARRATAKRVEEMMKEVGIGDPDTYASRVLPPEMRPGSTTTTAPALAAAPLASAATVVAVVTDKPGESSSNGGRRSVPQLFEYYRDTARARLIQRRDARKAAQAGQEATEAVPLPEFFRSPKRINLGQAELDAEFGLGRARWFKRPEPPGECGWEVLRYLEPSGKMNDYTWDEKKGMWVPHGLLCPKGTGGPYRDEFRHLGYTLWAPEGRVPETSKE